MSGSAPLQYKGPNADDDSTISTKPRHGWTIPLAFIAHIVGAHEGLPSWQLAVALPLTTFHFNAEALPLCESAGFFCRNFQTWLL